MAQAIPATLTPRDIILEIGRNLHASCIPLLSRVIAPSVYEVFLHPDDYYAQERTFHLIQEDAAHHLTRELEQLNKPPRLKIPGRETLPHQRDGQDWVIHFRIDPNGEIPRGGLLIASQLRVPDGAAGAKTQRTTTMRFEDGARTDSAATGPAAADSAATGSLAFAQLTHNGAQFQMRREEISIGRGGDGRWVDFQLTGNRAISKEHLSIRYAGGRFEAKDTSTNGATLNGQRMTPGVWTPLGSSALFELAKGVVVEFRALR